MLRKYLPGGSELAARMMRSGRLVESGCRVWDKLPCAQTVWGWGWDLECRAGQEVGSLSFVFTFLFS